MKLRYKYNSKSMNWEQQMIKVIVNYDDERLSWCSVADVATDLFNESGYYVNIVELSIASRSPDYIVTSKEYLRKALTK